MRQNKIEAVGVFIPVRKMGGVEYIVLLPDDVLPLRDGQTVKVTAGQIMAQASA